jgi:L-ribulose-5-phosphate 3-epimerase
MNPLAGHCGTYYSYSFEQALAGIAAAGFQHVELAAVPGGTEHVDVHGDPAAVRALLDRHGLEAVSISGHSELGTPEGLEHGLAVVRWAAEFGIPIVNSAVGGHLHVAESEAAFMANIGTLADAAATAGVVVALEIHGDLMASGALSAPLLDRIGHPAVKVNYDTANVEYYSGERAVDDLPHIADRVAHVHLKDIGGGKGEWNFPAIGQGHVDFARVLEILAGVGYSGPYSVEIEFMGDPWPPLDEVNAAMRSSYEALAALGLS